jgi:predicted nucleotidyltransferase
MSDPRTSAAKLTAQFRSALADELRSVVVFGSLPRGESIPGVSDLNLIILLESMLSPTLFRTAPILQQWIRQGNTPPHLHTWDEWKGMQSTFAIEIADMCDAREVLWGEDPVTMDTIPYASLRLQTAREIRNMLLHLRLRLMVATNGPSEVGALLLSGFPSMAAYMRSALRLSGESPGLPTPPVIERTARLLGIDPSPMMTCFEARRTTHHLGVGLTDPIVDRYMTFASTLLKYVEQLPANHPAPDTRDDGPRGGGLEGGGGGGGADNAVYAPPSRLMGVKS